MIAFEETGSKNSESCQVPTASIKVIGIGGAGGNNVNYMIDAGFQGIDFIVANTDLQALELSKAPNKVQIGVKSTKGLGTGADPEVGKRATEEDIDKVMEHLESADIVFLTAGMGGGTGSGGLPVIARHLKERGILSIAVVTKPFQFEGKRRSVVADGAIELIRSQVDTMIVIPNQKLIEITGEDTSVMAAFNMINDVLGQSVKGISDIIARPGHMNVDFADVKSVMKETGVAIMGTGRAAGEDRAVTAATQAVSSSLLENMSIRGARGVLLNITGSESLGLFEVSSAASIIYDQVDDDANIILGSVIDETMGDEVAVTVIATGVGERGVSGEAESSDEVLVEASKAVSEVEPGPELEQSEADSEVSPEVEVAASEDVTSEVEGNSALVDVDSLDIPTFLRNEKEKGA